MNFGSLRSPSIDYGASPADGNGRDPGASTVNLSEKNIVSGRDGALSGNENTSISATAQVQVNVPAAFKEKMKQKRLKNKS